MFYPVTAQEGGDLTTARLFYLLSTMEQVCYSLYLAPPLGLLCRGPPQCAVYSLSSRQNRGVCLRREHRTLSCLDAVSAETGHLDPHRHLLKRRALTKSGTSVRDKAHLRVLSARAVPIRGAAPKAIRSLGATTSVHMWPPDDPVPFRNKTAQQRPNSIHKSSMHPYSQRFNNANRVNIETHTNTPNILLSTAKKQRVLVSTSQKPNETTHKKVGFYDKESQDDLLSL